MKFDTHIPFHTPSDPDRTFTGAASQLAEAERLAGLGSWTWRDGARTIFCSGGLLQFIGGIEPELSLRSIVRHIHPDDRRALFAQVRTARHAGSGALELRLRSGAEPRVFAASIRGGCTTKGHAVLWGVCHDITAPHRVKKALLRSESRWEMALETARQGVWDYDVRHHSVGQGILSDTARIFVTKQNPIPWSMASPWGLARC